jgi:hypothetical protein
MIDNPEKTDRLVAELKASLPVETRLSQILMRAIEKQTPDLAVPDSCNVVSIFYTGEEGGIVCGLDIGGPNTKTPYIVSITHLIFDRRMPNVPANRRLSAPPYQKTQTAKPPQLLITIPMTKLDALLFNAVKRL